MLERQLVTVGLGPDRRGLLVDISESGAAVQPYTELQTGDTSPVRFQLPGSTSVIEAEGVVSWVGPTGRAGIRFLNVPEDSQERLRRWIDGLAPAALPEITLGAALATAAYLPPSYSPWVRMSDLKVEPSRLDDDVSDLDLVSALRLVVERSRAVTRASGAAIALADKEEMVCRARTGVAPDLGARFRPDSGLSGEAVRTAKTVRCTDTSNDHRVDRVACERLNVRSIVITPVLSSAAVIGVIEVFSPKPQAFDERDVLHLRRMADLVAAMLENSINHFEMGFLPEAEEDPQEPVFAGPAIVAQQPELRRAAEEAGPSPAPTQPAAEEAPPATEAENFGAAAERAVPEASVAPESAPHEPLALATGRYPLVPADDSAVAEPAVESAQPETASAKPAVQEVAPAAPSPEQIETFYKGFMQQAGEEDRRRRNRTIGMVLAVLLLVAVAVTFPYWLPRKKAPLAPQRVLPSSSANQGQTSLDLPAVIPEPSKQVAPAAKPSIKPGASQTKARGERWSFLAPTKPGTGSELKLESPQPPSPEPAPEMTSPGGGVKVINDMVGSWGEPDVSGSENRIVEGKLINRIDPIFPPHVNHAAARGRVVVRIGIDKAGRVERTDPISGDPTLSAAALQAIRQWRYEPYQMDGQPIAVEKTITIDFTAQR